MRCVGRATPQLLVRINAPHTSFVVALTFLCAMAASFEAGAQPLPSTSPALSLETRAQELYQQGRERFFVGEFEQARAAFQASLDTSDSPNARMYLGRALQRLGRNAEAWAMLDRAARDAANRAASEPRYTPTRDSARAEADALASSIAWLVVDVAAAPDDVAVRVNGHAVQRAGLGVEIPLDPGAVVVEVSARGVRDVRREMSLSAGAHARVALTLEALPAPPAVVEPPPVARVTPPRVVLPTVPTPSRALRNAGVATLAVGGAAVLAGVALRALAQSQYDTLVDQQRAGTPDRDLTDAGEQNQALSYVFLGAGAGVALAGAVMLFAGARSLARPAALTLSAHPRGLTLGGRF